MNDIFLWIYIAENDYHKAINFLEKYPTRGNDLLLTDLYRLTGQFKAVNRQHENYYSQKDDYKEWNGQKYKHESTFQCEGKKTVYEFKLCIQKMRKLYKFE